MQRSLRVVAAVVATLVLAAGCSSGDAEDTAAPPPSTSASAPEPTQSAPSTPVPTATPTPAKPGPAKKLKRGVEGPEVLALQQRLTELGYWNGKADSKFGSTTQQAIFAVQKAAGIGRDGTVGPKTQKALDQGVRPQARSKAGSGRVVEIDLKRQLLMIVDDGQVQRVFNTSTGNNETYESEGDTRRAVTPTGRYKVGRQIDGWRHAPLGELWRPKYFNGGIAVHGAPSVPPYAASHGCARVSMAAMNWIWSNDQIPLKTKVWVYRA